MNKFPTLIIIFLLPLNYTFTQTVDENCFNREEISLHYYKPSKKGKLLNKKHKKEIVFDINRQRNTSKVLKARMIDLLNSDKDLLTSEDSIRIKRAYQKFRICYFANYTDTIISIPTLINRIDIIQEAKDTNGIWRPIEVINGYIGCGTGVFGNIILNPKEFIEIYTPKYCGGFFTKLRMKLQVSGDVVISNEYEGFINTQQFDISNLIKRPYWKYLNFIDRDIFEELRMRDIEFERD